MAKVSNKIILLTKNYIKELERNGFPILMAFLFGSYAKGNYDEWSDIDVALISKKFEGKRFLDKDKIRLITLRYNTNISPLPYRPEDFNEDEDLFVKEILSTGIRIV